MSTVIVTLYSPGQHGSLDLELPREVQLRNLLPAMLAALKLPSVDAHGQPLTYQLTRQAGQPPLQETENLSGAGVVTGDVLHLVTTALPALPPLRNRSLLGNSALLRSFGGKVIVLENYGKDTLAVGRYDAATGKSPDIDLSDEPGGNTVSRDHALLRKQGNQWVLIPRSARNTTRVNNTTLTPAQPHVLQSNDVIALGGVKLKFEAGLSP